jgi:hypothetical protein
MLPLQPNEMIREALDSVLSLGGKLVGCGIIDPVCCSHDLVSAAQEGTNLAEERLRLLGRLRCRGGRAQVGGRAVRHGDSFTLSQPRGSLFRCYSDGEPDALGGGLCNAAGRGGR